MAVVEEIRASSRVLARRWGFLGGAFAGTDLPPSAVHALIEIEAGEISARELSTRLQLEKSSVSRMLRKLVESGDVQERPGEQDLRVKQLSLTAVGKTRVAGIHAHARSQVISALGRLKPREVRTVREGLRLYTDALASTTAEPTAITRSIQSGYRPGLIARVTQMHATYYAREVGFGQHFESLVASGLAEFCGRLGEPANNIWVGVQGGELLGSVAIDGQDLGPGIAHLRWFIVDDRARGGGLGRTLLSTALAHADELGFEETQLWTFSGLTAARHLYESQGFVCVDDRRGDQWGREASASSVWWLVA